ncbi:hypothetical protein ABH897_005157 [Paenibacillus sp. RC73]|uniref:DUF2326 domain-containing protein n=1 Tax=Paenibacillus sp. RC73 TaxID=3156250 RepID=UPI003832824D
MANSLYIHRVTVNPPIGKADVILRPGLNVVRAVLVDKEALDNNQIGSRNSVGKSTFIHLIDYGLGKDNFLNSNKETGRNKLNRHELLMEYKVGDQEYTVQRKLIDGENCSLYEGYVIDLILNGKSPISKTLSLSGYKDFLENSLYGGSNIINQKRYVSLRDVMHLLIREQVGGFDSIDSAMEYNESSEVKRKRIEFLAGLITPEKLIKEKEKSDSAKLVKNAKRSLDVIKKYVKEKVTKTEVQIKKLIRDTEKEVKEYSQEIMNLKKQLIELQITSDQRLEIKNNLLNKKAFLQKEMQMLSSRLNSYQATFNEITTESETLNVAQDARNVFGSIKYEQCPVCFVPITDDPDFVCPRKDHDKQSDDKAIHTIQTILHNEKKDLIQAIDTLKRRLFEIGIEIDNLNSQIDVVNEDIMKDTEKLLENIDVEEKKLSESQENLNLWTQSLRYLQDQARYKKIHTDEKTKLTGIENDLKEINESIKEQQDNLKILYDEVVMYLYDNTRSGVLDISENSGKFIADIRFIIDTLESDDGAAAKTLRVVAFDLALLKLALNSDTNHPKLLIHDSPNAREIDPIVYGRIFSFVKDELEEQRFEDIGEIDFQYIITTISVPKFLEDDTMYTRLTLSNDGDGGKLFEFTF